MAEIIGMIGSRGGVGCSTLTAMVGRGLAREGKRVLLIETVTGCRSLDLMLGVSNEVIHSIYDVINGNCKVTDAIVTCDEHKLLSVMSTTPSVSQPLPSAELGELLGMLSRHYEMILLDAGSDQRVVDLLPYERIDRMVITATADKQSIRAGRVLANTLFSHNVTEVRLIVNQLPARFEEMGILSSLDEMIDGICAQLLGVIPYDISVLQAGATGIDLPAYSFVYQIVQTIAQRLLGKYIDLFIK